VETGWSDAAKRRQAARAAGADEEPRGLPDPLIAGVGINDYAEGDAHGPRSPAAPPRVSPSE